MSRDDLHPAIRRQADFDGAPSNASAEDVTVMNQIKMCLQTPDQRAVAFDQLDQIMGEQGTSLRSKARVLQMRRRLAFTDNALRRVGR
jgi:hypothetical protein